MNTSRKADEVNGPVYVKTTEEAAEFVGVSPKNLRDFIRSSVRATNRQIEADNAKFALENAKIDAQNAEIDAFNAKPENKGKQMKRLDSIPLKDLIETPGKGGSYNWQDVDVRKIRRDYHENRGSAKGKVTSLSFLSGE